MIDKILQYLRKEFPGIPIEDKGNFFLLPTVCHNQDFSSASMKLYLYKNENKDGMSPLFHCFTECSETFNIYQLIIKIEKLKGKTITFKEAYKILHGQTFQKTKNEVEEKPTSVNGVFKNPLSIMLPEYSSGVLDMFDTSLMDPWALEGIDTPILERYKVSYSRSFEGVIIPHFDWRGRLVGVRIRSYNEFKETGYKYMPLFLNNQYYSHPLSFNLYGIYQNQKHIKKHRKCYLFEAEKSVLQYEHMFEEEENISLAVCGKNISKWQLDILIYFLEVEELIIGFDKEYSTIEGMYDYLESVKEKVKYAMAFMKIGVMLDEKNAFRLKEAPTDKTINDFNGMKIYYLKGE